MDRPVAATACRGIRGAITADDPGAVADAVHAATVELLDALVTANGCEVADLAAAIFTVSDDLAGSNPAAAARAHGWDQVPLLVVREHDESVGRCVRVLALWNTTRPQSEIHHVYLKGARALRPDLAGFA
ncbi:MAG: chorismate mutase [Actinomycetota bacterium]